MFQYSRFITLYRNCFSSSYHHHLYQLQRKMVKRAQSPATNANLHHSKKPRTEANIVQNKIATAENAAAVDKDPPLQKLLEMIQNGVKLPEKGDVIVYWMRMEDMRICDNRALSQASSQAKDEGIPLIVLYIISPQDYTAHDKGPRRIDFMLRNLSVLKESLDKLNIPLHTVTYKPRRALPDKLISLLESWNVKSIYANLEYEVDELRRDIRVCEIGLEKGIRCMFVHDRLVVEPGRLLTKQGKPYTIYTPWLNNWTETLNNNITWLSEAAAPEPNDLAVRHSGLCPTLFQSLVPHSLEGFECVDKDNMAAFWPAGTDVARQMLDRFLSTKARSEQLGDVSPLTEGAVRSAKEGRILKYNSNRDRADMDTSSRLSPYLACGIISAREIIRATMDFLKVKKVQTSREHGVGVWVQEIAWRDFYNHVMAAFPRVSMGRPFQEKFAAVKWETNEAHLQAWKDGKTGVPIVDAAMRQLKAMGWIHNRCRMIAAMYLTKDLMLDWRLGEKYFMEQLIDGDLASNNGGWQWSASTGTDPQPYFRIFNPYSQSEKADPSGDYIRHYIPELAKLKEKAIHEPPAESAERHNYPRPLVDHKSARERALRRYKNPGDT